MTRLVRFHTKTISLEEAWCRPAAVHGVTGRYVEVGACS